jgi:hypothetical protein
MGGITMSFAIDMSNPVIRKRVVVLTAIARLKLELKGLKVRGPAVLPAMREYWGFTSRTKKAMLAELEAWKEVN